MQLAMEKKPAILSPSGEAIHIKWEKVNPLPAPLSSGTAVVHNGKIYYGGYLDVDLESSLIFLCTTFIVKSGTHHLSKHTKLFME